MGLRLLPAQTLRHQVLLGEMSGRRSVGGRMLTISSSIIQQIFTHTLKRVTRVQDVIEHRPVGDDFEFLTRVMLWSYWILLVIHLSVAGCC